MITREMVSKGRAIGAIRLDTSPNGDGTVCRIGENWFYFGGQEAENSDPEEYLKNVGEEGVRDEIFTTLEDFREAPYTYEDEYKYYESYLISSIAYTPAEIRPFYFTFGTDERYPYSIHDLVVVYAADKSQAIQLFRAVHPDRERNSGVYNAAACYSQEQVDGMPEWNTYYPNGPVETIRLNIEKN